MASTWGWLLGGLILPGVTMIIAGVLVGAFQWLVLQGRLAHAWRWIVATSAGWIIGYLITLLMLPQEFEFLQGMIIGLTTGIAQWMILRREFHWAGWWIIFSTMGWITGLTLLQGVLLSGTMSGALSGLCLEILLRNPKPKTTAASFSL